MARVRAACSGCKEVLLVYIHDEDPDLKQIEALVEGEHFEHKCPICREWTGFKIVPPLKDIEELEEG